MFNLTRYQDTALNFFQLKDAWVMGLTLPQGGTLLVSRVAGGVEF